MSPADDGVARALAGMGVSRPFTVSVVKGGGNNRVFRVDSPGKRYLAKVFFRHAGDRRDRMGAETAFLRFAEAGRLSCVPRLIAADPPSRTILMEYVEGRKLRPGEVTWPRIREAAAFFVRLNRGRNSAAARKLTDGSEACFSVASHVACVARRLDRLRGLRPRSGVDRDAVRFVDRELGPAWEKVSGVLLGTAGQTQDLDRDSRCISPSDFGFHNAILRGDGRLCFIDFEYAGWDDPAKTVCDFFCQPAVPVPGRHLSRFVEAISGGLARPEGLGRRVRGLLPAYRLKWCCILMNEFLSVGGARRRFAGKDCDSGDRKADQLKKARAVLKGLKR